MYSIFMDMLIKNIALGIDDLTPKLLVGANWVPTLKLFRFL